MFLKSLTLKGFKSFADPTTLEFEPGITVIVGPNGSGKSNVVDAVAWVLGAQGPRTLRSSRMDDVVFAGTPARPALGRAEVSLTIDNSSGRLPIDLAEVTISRTLFRSGESEYAINGAPCRLLDVQELLSDAGVGRQQHVIVGQGQLDQILDAKPEERRLVVEEAAGILKYRQRRERARRRLEAAASDIERLGDLLREVRRQVRPLERQAEAARRHDELAAELRALRLHLSGLELAELESRLAAAAAARSELDVEEQQASARLARLDDDVAACEASLAALHDERLAGALTRAERLAERAAGLAAVLAERERALRALRHPTEAVEAERLEAEAARLRAELEQTGAEAAALVGPAEDLARAEAELAGERARLDAEQAALRAEEAEEAAVDAEEEPPSAFATRPPARLATAEARLEALRRSAARDEAELARLEADLADKARRIGDRESRLASARAELALRESERAAAEAEARSAAAARRAAEERLAAAEHVARRALEARHLLAARREALEASLAEARRTAGLAHLVGLEGVHGLLGELVEVDEGFEAALRAALESVLEAVVVSDGSAAARALGALEHEGSQGTVLPVLDGRAASEGGVPPGRVALRAHVRGRVSLVDALLDGLLAGVVVEGGDWRAAAALAAQHRGLVVVTRRGDRFGPSGWRLAAHGSPRALAALPDARRRAAAAAAASEAASASLEAARQAAASAGAVEAEALRVLDRSAAAAEALGAELGRLEAGVAEAREEHEEARARAAALRDRLEEETAELRRLEAELPRLREAEREAAAARQARVTRRERLVAGERALAERAGALEVLRRDLEVRAAALEERRALLGRTLAEVEARLVDARAAVRAREADAARERATAVAVARLASLVEAARGRLDATLRSLREAVEARSRESAELGRRAQDLRRERLAAERALVEVRERAQRLDLQAAEARLRLEAAAETLARELDATPEEARQAPCPPLPPGTGSRERARALERELRLLGPVNPLAVEELASLEERARLLGSQLDDLHRARREAGRIIRAVDGEIVSVFSSAFADVAAHFSSLCATLFPGGSGTLRLTDPDDLLETGIEVDVRPAGKHLRQLSLLSGGERSLAALAFLCAVFRSRPSPFYLLDEVEAALDDVNLHRFLALLEEFRDEAQLIIVSHQRRTMDIADALYGVTLTPSGASRVVSQRVRVEA